MVADSIRQPSVEFDYPYFRTFSEINAVLDTNSLLRHRDKIHIRVAVSDRAGNKTYYDSSSTILDYDPYKPIVSEINGGNVFNNGELPDTLTSNDTLSAKWSESRDVNTVENTIVYNGSGISGYSYRIHKYDSIGTYIDTLVSWRSNGLNEEVIVDFGLAHNHQYSFSIRAVDTAGNVSDTVSSLKKYRENTPPIVNIDSLINAFEDIELSLIHI